MIGVKLDESAEKTAPNNDATNTCIYEFGKLNVYVVVLYDLEWQERFLGHQESADLNILSPENTLIYFFAPA